jgi:hypothetical protein
MEGHSWQKTHPREAFRICAHQPSNYRYCHGGWMFDPPYPDIRCEEHQTLLLLLSTMIMALLGTSQMIYTFHGLSARLVKS